VTFNVVEHVSSNTARQSSYRPTSLCLEKVHKIGWLHNVNVRARILIIFGRTVTEKTCNQNVLHFPPHLINASALPGETRNPEIASFHLNAAC